MERDHFLDGSTIRRLAACILRAASGQASGVIHAYRGYKATGPFLHRSGAGLMHNDTKTKNFPLKISR
jgi:hypothetical protein